MPFRDDKNNQQREESQWGFDFKGGTTTYRLFFKRQALCGLSNVDPKGPVAIKPTGSAANFAKSKAMRKLPQQASQVQREII